MLELGYSINMPICDEEILSYGPIVVFRTQKYRNLPAEKLKMEIIHGWTPMLLSTAKCFTKLMCYFREPVYAPFIAKLVVDGSDIVVYTQSSNVKIIGEKEADIDQRSIQDDPIVFDSSVVNIFMADMKKYGEKVEMHISSKMTIYNEVLQTIVVAPGTKITILYY